MIGPDLVRARRRGDKLFVSALKASEREAATEIAGGVLDVLLESVGATQEAVLESLETIHREPNFDKMYQGLRKLALDECEFQSMDARSAAELRLELFELAAKRRAALHDDDQFNRHRILEEYAEGKVKPEVIDAFFLLISRGPRACSFGQSLCLAAPRNLGTGSNSRCFFAPKCGFVMRRWLLTPFAPSWAS